MQNFLFEMSAIGLKCILRPIFLFYFIKIAHCVQLDKCKLGLIKIKLVSLCVWSGLCAGLLPTLCVRVFVRVCGF